MRPPIPWPGGKAKLAEDLIAMFPPARLYCEPFMGAASVFWNLPDGSYEQRVVNDIDNRLVNLFRCIRDRKNEMQDAMKWIVHSREEFVAKLNEMKDECCCKCHGDLRKAVAYFFLLKTAHNTCPRSPGNFRSGSKEIKSLFNPNFDLEPYRQKLVNVVVENLDFQAVIEKYDKEDAFFFVDPPYAFDGADALYEESLTPEDHLRLKDCLSKTTGKWLITYNDCAFVRDLYKEFNLHEARFSYNTTAGKRNTETDDESGLCRMGKELIVTNYRVEEELPLFRQGTI